MKTFKALYLPLFLLGASLAGCTDNELAEASSAGQEIKVSASLTADARTSYQENATGIQTLWKQGDAIGLTTDTQSNLKYTANSADATTDFKHAGTPLQDKGETVYAYYPYTDASNGVEVVLPNTYNQYYKGENEPTQNENGTVLDFIYTEGTAIDNASLKLQFKHYFAFIKLNVPIASLSKYNGIYALDVSSSANICVHSNTHINLTNRDYVQGKAFVYTTLYYHINPALIPDGSDEVTCYIPVLPIADAGKNITIKDVGSGTVLLSKDTPQGGFEAGKVYSVNLAKSSYKDGDTFVIQKATEGTNPINLAFMGEGFTAADMEKGGKYETRMKEAAEQLFKIEPYKSLRNRFSIYGVAVVRTSDNLTKDYDFLFEDEYNENNGIDKAGKKAREYAQKVTEVNWANDLRVAVIYNTESYIDGLRSRCIRWDSYNGQFVALLKSGINTELNHELGGHGIAGLQDEYVESGWENYSIPVTYDYSTDGTYYLDYFHGLGIAANISYKTGNQLTWAHMLADDRYKSIVGTFEGAYKYGKGVYRPTETSIMRNSYNNECEWFNAPSREAIYKAVMKLSEGTGWAYKFEDFATFDAENREKDPKVE